MSESVLAIVNLALGTAYGCLAIALFARTVHWGSFFSFGMPTVVFGTTRCVYYVTLGIVELHTHNNIAMTWTTYLLPIGTTALYAALLAAFFRWGYNIRQAAQEAIPASWTGLLGGVIGLMAIVFGSVQVFFLSYQTQPTTPTMNHAVIDTLATVATYTMNLMSLLYLVIVLYAAYGLHYSDHTKSYHTHVLVLLAILLVLSRLYSLAIIIIAQVLNGILIDILDITLMIIPELLILLSTVIFNIAVFGEDEQRRRYRKRKEPAVEMATYPTVQSAEGYAEYRPHDIVPYDNAYEKEQIDDEEGGYDPNFVPPPPLPDSPFTPRPYSSPVHLPPQTARKKSAEYQQHMSYSRPASLHMGSGSMYPSQWDPATSSSQQPLTNYSPNELQMQQYTRARPNSMLYGPQAQPIPPSQAYVAHSLAQRQSHYHVPHTSSLPPLPHPGPSSSAGVRSSFYSQDPQHRSYAPHTLSLPPPPKASTLSPAQMESSFYPQDSQLQPYVPHSQLRRLFSARNSVSIPVSPPHGVQSHVGHGAGVDMGYAQPISEEPAPLDLVRMEWEAQRAKAEGDGTLEGR